jgi:small subunit ribosomal protein S20
VPHQLHKKRFPDMLSRDIRDSKSAPFLMPVTKTAKRALRVSNRRHAENLRTKAIYKKAVKVVRKAVESGAGNVNELVSKAQSALDTATKSKTIHKNKAARLKSRLAKRVTAVAGTITAAPKAAAKKATTKKKPAAKKSAKK